MVDSLSYFLFQPVMHIKEPLLLIRKSSPCGGSGFPLSQSEWSFTICLTPYNRKYNVLSALLNKTLPPPPHGGPIELFLIPASAPCLV